MQILRHQLLHASRRVIPGSARTRMRSGAGSLPALPPDVRPTRSSPSGREERLYPTSLPSMMKVRSRSFSSPRPSLQIPPDTPPGAGAACNEKACAGKPQAFFLPQELPLSIQHGNAPSPASFLISSLSGKHHISGKHAFSGVSAAIDIRIAPAPPVPFLHAWSQAPCSRTSGACLTERISSFPSQLIHGDDLRRHGTKQKHHPFCLRTAVQHIRPHANIVLRHSPEGPRNF